MCIKFKNGAQAGFGKRQIRKQKGQLWHLNTEGEYSKEKGHYQKRIGACIIVYETSNGAVAQEEKGNFNTRDERGHSAEG